jgi:hypothetical protein
VVLGSDKLPATAPVWPLFWGPTVFSFRLSVSSQSTSNRQTENKLTTKRKKNCWVFPRVKTIQGPINGRGKQDAKDQNKLENHAKTVETINLL